MSKACQTTAQDIVEGGTVYEVKEGESVVYSVVVNCVPM